MSKGMLPADAMQNESMSGMIQQDDEQEPPSLHMIPNSNNYHGQKGMDLGLNPANYANIEDEV